MTHVTTRQGQPLSVIAKMREIVDGWLVALERHRVFERTYAELNSLTDRELADIGVNRSQVVEISWDAARQT